MTVDHFQKLADKIESDIETRFDLANSSSTEFALLRLLERYRKKFSCNHSKELEQAAVDSFVSSNEAVRLFRASLSSYEINNASLFIRRALEMYSSRFAGAGPQEVLFLPGLYDLWSYGPGASNGIRGTHAAEKCNQPPTATISSLPEVFKFYSADPYLRFLIEDRRSIRVVSGSRLSTVPKNEEKARTIAIEPLANMQLQLAAGRYIQGALRCIGIDITVQQDVNKRLARLGSIDGSLSTLDMKSASDMISLELVRLLWPPEWFRFFMAIRSPETELPGGESITLFMISTMGNGFTFPLMTLTILALLYASHADFQRRPLWLDMDRFAVFGDDVICPTYHARAVMDILTRAGFVVNTDKSYTSGPFRESCGGDYYEGVDVSPFYIRSLSSNAEIYVAMNQVIRYCCKLGIVMPGTLLYLKSLIRGPLFFVPEWHSDDAGVRCVCCEARYSYLKVTSARRVYSGSDLMLPMLALAGWLEQGSASRPWYMPRPYKTTHKVKRTRLPSGFLEGYDPIYLGRVGSSYASLLVSAVLK